MKENYFRHLDQKTYQHRLRAATSLIADCHGRRRVGPGRAAAFIIKGINREWDHNKAHQQRAKAAKRRVKAHRRASQQGKAWKAEYDTARRQGERFIHAEPVAHPLLRAIKGQITFA